MYAISPPPFDKQYMLYKLSVIALDPLMLCTG
jgi:hypothetical protein